MSFISELIDGDGMNASLLPKGKTEKG